MRCSETTREFGRQLPSWAAVAHDDPLEESLDEALVDRRSADALARDYGPRGSVRIGRRGRWFRIGAILAVALLAAYYVATFAQVVQTGRSHGADRADAIVVMGAAQYDGRPSPQLAARLDHVVDLWEGGVAPTVVVTGGKLAGDRFTEAEASARYLIERGLPADAIVQVGEGATTVESVAAAAPAMSDRGIVRVALVTDPYHSLRSRLIVEEHGFDVDVASTDTTIVTGWSAFRRNVTEAGGVALGRIIGFDRVSDLTN